MEFCVKKFGRSVHFLFKNRDAFLFTVNSDTRQNIRVCRTKVTRDYCKKRQKKEYSFYTLAHGIVANEQGFGQVWH